MDNLIYLAVDGDSAGQLVGRAVLANDVQSLHEVSSRINHGQEIISHWAESNGGEVISAGGDEGNICVPASALENIEQLRADYSFSTQLTLTVGVGNSLSEAGKALMVGKLRGKNQVCQYDQKVEQEYSIAQQSANDGTATGEGKKLGDAYMKTVPIKESEDSHADCPYCKEMEESKMEDPDHCKECHNMDDHADCPYCKEMDANAHNADEEGHPDDCPYCAEMDQEQAAPEDQMADQSQMPPQQSAPMNQQDDIAAMAEQAAQPVLDLPQNDPEEMQQVPNQSPGSSLENDKETNKEVLTQLSNEEGLPDQSQNDARIDGNQNGEADEHVEQSMGMDEDQDAQQQPDLSSVLKDGLDSHADNIQREKVVQLVSTALQGFKSCKDILERSQSQAPQLYSASITMLRAMIEMAKMLGLAGNANAEQPLEEQGAPQQAPPQQAAPQGQQGIPQGDNSEGK